MPARPDPPMPDDGDDERDATRETGGHMQKGDERDPVKRLVDDLAGVEGKVDPGPIEPESQAPPFPHVPHDIFPENAPIIPNQPFWAIREMHQMDK